MAASIVAETQKPAAAGLEHRFNRLLTANAAALRRLAASYANPGERDDLVQEIAIALWRALPRFRGDCSERTFLFRIAHNRCITHLAAKRPTVSLDDAGIEPADPAPGSEARIQVEQDQQRFINALRDLPLIHREVVVLVLEDLEYREIAQIVGISETNVGVRLSRARQQLRKRLEEGS